ncbi:hypothetical protein [Sinomonas gamaensis]|uniref:hypothetical protein n=1 Tax=Sinomonas gamaensis TaxID=2565624 RepID=UPI0011091077|nr:hypothetical protein [Sinomonas gamaensis]
MSESDRPVPVLDAAAEAHYRSLWIIQHLLEAQELGVDSKTRLKELVEEHTGDPEQALLEHLRTVVRPEGWGVTQS